MGLVTDGLLVNRSGGFGQVFAEKRLKAIALRGTEEIRLAKPSQFQQLITDMLDYFREKKQTFFEIIHTKFARIDLPLLRAIHHHGIEKRACFACPVACLHMREDRFLPNLTVVFCFARLLGIERQADAERLYSSCVELGIDPVALSLAARCLLELEAAEKIDESPFRLGDTAGLMQLLKDKEAIIHKGNVGLAKEYGLESECENLLNIINKQWEQIFSGIENLNEKRQVLNALGLCDYALLIFPYADLIKAFSLATGKELNKASLVGKRE
jgi:aldehyde:ferredoxin oxidoreductase